MIRLVEAELFKLRTTPGPWVVVAVTVLLTGLGITEAFIVGHHGVVHFGPPTTDQDLRSLVGAGYIAGVVMAPVLGVICITSEYRHKVLTATLLLAPRRSEVITAKILAAAVWGVLLCAFSLLMVGAMGIPLLITQGGSVHRLLTQAPPVVPGLFGAYALLTVYGVGIGTLVKNQIGGVVLALGLSLVLEPIVVLIFSSLWHMNVNFFPQRATQAVAGGLIARGGGGNGGSSLTVAGLLSWWLGVLALLAWGLGTTVVGYFASFRRDVT